MSEMTTPGAPGESLLKATRSALSLVEVEEMTRLVQEVSE
jgi:hypothetical protein